VTVTDDSANATMDVQNEALAGRAGRPRIAPKPLHPRRRSQRAGARYCCLAAAGRHTIKAIARELDNAHQQMAAQYRMLTG
jgi:hypothetical protein